MKRAIEKKQCEARRLIFEMIDAAVDLAEEKGTHPLMPGCNCIACIVKRKQLLKDQPTRWKFSL